MNLTSGELYFINEVDVLTGAATPFHKIGLVKDLRQGDVGSRVDEHQTGNPRRLVVVDRVDSPAISDLESTVHNRFARLRVLGEWFVLEPHQLEQVATAARALAAEQSAHLPALEAAAELVKIQSTDIVRTPTADDVEWYLRLRSAKALAKRVGALRDRSENLFKAAIDQGADVGLYAGWTEKTRTTFDKERFAESYPELFEQFHKETAASPVFSVKNAKDVAVPEPGEEYREFEQRFFDALDIFESGDLDAERLHQLHLELLGFQAAVKWDAELAEANLKVACGADAGIDGLVGWNRTPRTNRVFDSATLKREHLNVWSEFAVEVPSRSFAVLPMRSYRVGNPELD